MSFPFDKNKYPNCARGHQYAIDVVNGKIISCIYIIGACKRYLRDVSDSHHHYFYFDPNRAEKFLRLVQKFEHVIGNWKTPNIVFEPWQCWLWMNVMGFINRESGYRRFRICHGEIARGNGKSPMAAGASLYFLALDDPNGNQISTAATKKDQARIVLDSARAMARKNKSYLKATGVRVLAHQIVHEKSNSHIRALSSDANGMDGLNDVLAVLDELHAMQRATFEVITSGMSKRKDSLTLCITTAGFDTDSVGYSQSCYAKKVALGEHIDEQFFAAVWTLDENDDIFDEDNWKKANPNYGSSVDPVTFKAKAEKAKVSPADIPNFKVKHLNLWLSDDRAYFDLQALDKCAVKTLKLEDFKGKYCKAAVDLSSTRDVTSTAYIFKENGIFYGFTRNFIPKDRATKVRSVQFDQAIARDQLIATKGASIDNNFIREDIKAKSKIHRITECAFDPWNAKEMSMNLAQDGIEMVKFAMNVGNLSEPMKRLDSLISEGKFIWDGSEFFRWTMSNVIAREDANGNVFPRKAHEDFKIDPVVAMIMALALWLQDQTKESVYETRGVLVL